MHSTKINGRSIAKGGGSSVAVISPGSVSGAMARAGSLCLEVVEA
jgi:hypothetical protein